MTDPEILALLEECGSAECGLATIAALADKLLEASAADRLECVQRFAEVARRLSNCRDATTLIMGRYDGGQRFAANSSLSRRDVAMNPEHFARMQADTLRRVVDGVGKAIEQDRWYAVRFVTQTRQADEATGNYFADLVRIQTVANVVPLDGGLITPVAF